MSAFTIRSATLNDAEVLAQLQAEMDDEGAHPADTERMWEVLAAMATYPDFQAYLVLQDGLAVATFSLLIFVSPSHRGSRQALLDAVVVTRALRGKGVGELMIRHAMQLATEKACYKMSLSSNLKRRGAHRFYERLGFAQHGISFEISLGEADA